MQTSGSWWFCATEEEGYYVAGAGDKELTNLISREQAQLIASAPYLLEAVRTLLPIAARVIQGTTDGEPMLKQARAAIARATEE
jgi:hypothetical protein